jgi:hypothetical protein
MPGTRIPGKSISDAIQGGSIAAVTAAQVLTAPQPAYIATFNGRVYAVKAYAGVAGTGGGNTVLDVQINGQSVWAVASAQPTLLATSTGEFNNAIGSRGSFRAGDRITLLVTSISTTGHGQLSVAVALGAA